MDATQVKARYIQSFVKYITWPNRVHAENDPVRVAVLGNAQLKAALGDLINKGQARNCVLAESTESANIVYVHDTDRERLGQLLSSLPPEILTLGEGPTFLNRGGMMEFNLSEGKVRFSVNLPSIRHAKLSVEPKLLMAAQEVRK